MGGLNLDKVTTDDSGRISFSGAASNIDWRKAVDQIFEVKKKTTVDKIAADITVNQKKINVYNAFGQRIADFQKTLSSFAGDVSFDQSKDIFAKKIATGTVIATGASADSYVAASATNQASSTSIDIEVTKLAKSHKIRGQSILFATNVALGFSGDMVFEDPTTGAITATVSVGASDTLATIRDKISASPANIQASILSVTPTNNYLVLTSTLSGTVSEIKFHATSTNALLDGQLGLATFGMGAYSVSNPLIPPDPAEFTLDLVPLTRNTNVISDAINSVTLQLLQLTPSPVRMVVQQDIGNIRTQLDEMVRKYNDIMRFFNQNLDVPSDPTAPLPDMYNDPILKAARESFLAFASSTVAGAADSYKGLANFGITFVDGNSGVVDPVDRNNLQIDTTVLDRAILTAPEQLQKLLSFSFDADDPDLQLFSYRLDFKNTYEVGTMFITTMAGVMTNAVCALGTTSISSNRISFTGGDSSGLVMSFTGTTDRVINFSYSQGLATQLSNQIRLLSRSGGTLEATRTSLTQVNQYKTEARTRALDRLKREKDQMIEKFIKMEKALTASQSILDNLNQMFGTKSQ